MPFSTAKEKREGKINSATHIYALDKRIHYARTQCNILMSTIDKHFHWRFRYNTLTQTHFSFHSFGHRKSVGKFVYFASITAARSIGLKLQVLVKLLARDTCEKALHIYGRAGHKITSSAEWRKTPVPRAFTHTHIYTVDHPVICCTSYWRENGITQNVWTSRLLSADWVVFPIYSV